MQSFPESQGQLPPLSRPAVQRSGLGDSTKHRSSIVSIVIERPKNEQRQLIYERFRDLCSEEKNRQRMKGSQTSLKELTKHRYSVLPTPLSILKFSSEFACGNLARVYYFRQSEYVLLLQHDTDSQEHCNWFYFNAKNTQPGVFTFHIINLTRPYMQAMSPLAWSQRAHIRENQSWEPTVTTSSSLEELTYFQEPSQIKRFAVTFKYQFKFAKDSVFFAYAYPYSFSQLWKFLNDISDQYTSLVTVRVLSKTLGGIDCPYLMISEDSSLEVAKGFTNSTRKGREKQVVVITARVHPGESNSSYIVEGLINHLLGSSKSAIFLRQSFVFVVVPMLNPDGVQYGNYRCSKAGVDLNRTWLSPSENFHPTIHATKQLISSLGKIALFCDIHGHSKEKNAFMYGCMTRNNPRNATVEIIPVLMALRNKHFSYAQCHFRIEKHKETTARVCVYREFSVVNSYTLECSLFGAHALFTVDDLKSIGADLAKSCKGISSRDNLRKSLEKIKAFKDMIPQSSKSSEFISQKNKTEDFSRKVAPIHNLKSFVHDKDSAFLRGKSSFLPAIRNKVVN